MTLILLSSPLSLLAMDKADPYSEVKRSHGTNSWYVVLGIDRSATTAEIHTAYELKKKDPATKGFFGGSVLCAYNILSDEAKRKVQDEYLALQDRWESSGNLEALEEAYQKDFNEDFSPTAGANSNNGSQCKAFYERAFGEETCKTDLQLVNSYRTLCEDEYKAAAKLVLAEERREMEELNKSIKADWKNKLENFFLGSPENISDTEDAVGKKDGYSQNTHRMGSREKRFLYLVGGVACIVALVVGAALYSSRQKKKVRTARTA